MRKEVRLTNCQSWADALCCAQDTHFQPALLSRREYILPMSPIPIMPMLLLLSMVTVVHAAVRGCRVGVQPMMERWTKECVADEERS